MSDDIKTWGISSECEAYIDGKIGTGLLDTGLWIASDVAYVNHCETAGDLGTKD